MGPPLPLLPSFPLRHLLVLTDSRRMAGAWFRGPPTKIRLCGRSCRRTDLLVAGDLGYLIRRCAGVIVREGAHAVMLERELLIQWRTLEVVTGTPACPHQLRELFPDSEINGQGFQVPIRTCPPEVVLAECLTHGIPVAGTHIIYRSPRQLTSG